MKILSIDVGMRNLAFCLFSITNDLNYKIEKWDILDLCNDKEHICMGIKKNKEKCDKKAKYCKNNEYYCKNHAKNKQYIIPTNDINIKKIEKLSFKKLKTFAEKYGIESKKIKKAELLKE